MTGTTPQSGQFKDPFARLGHGAGRSFLKGLADQVAIGDHFALGTIDVGSPQSVQAPLSESDHVALNRDPTHADDLGRFPGGIVKFRGWSESGGGFLDAVHEDGAGNYFRQQLRSVQRSPRL